MCEVPGQQLVLDPIGEAVEPPLAAGAGTRVAGDLRAKRVAIVDNRMAGMRDLAAALEADLRRYEVGRTQYWAVPHSIRPGPDVLARIARESDVAIIGLGNCGACTTWECRLSAELRASIPTLDVVTEPFEGVARAGFRRLGLPDQPLVVLPADVDHAAVPQLRQHAAHVADACAAELTDATAR